MKCQPGHHTSNRKYWMRWWQLGLWSLSPFHKSYLRAVLGHRLQMVAASHFTNDHCSQFLWVLEGSRMLRHGSQVWCFFNKWKVSKLTHDVMLHITACNVANLMKRTPGSLATLGWDPKTMRESSGLEALTLYVFFPKTERRMLVWTWRRGSERMQPMQMDGWQRVVRYVKYKWKRWRRRGAN